MIVQIREVIPVKGIITQLLDAAVIFSPFAAKRLPGFPALLRGVVRISGTKYIPEVLLPSLLYHHDEPWQAYYA
jgi:hypothetical protein